MLRGSYERKDIIRLFKELECVIEVVFLELSDNSPKKRIRLRG